MRIIESLVNLAIFVGMFFLYAVIGTIIGALTGWVVGIFFGTPILAIFSTIGIEGFTMTQIGAFLGFVGSFFRSVNIHDYSRFKFNSRLNEDARQNANGRFNNNDRIKINGL